MTRLILCALGALILSTSIAGAEPEALDAVAAAPAPKVEPAAVTAVKSVMTILKDERLASFAFDFRKPEAEAGDRTIVLLHGSGGDETTLMALARKMAPNANLLGIRGRIRQDGINRWYRRITPTTFDQTDVRSEADAFVSFLKDTAGKLKIDLDKAIFVGYSNGANLIAALSVLHPDIVHKAALLRAMPVLDKTPDAKLGNIDVLTIAGRSDKLYGPFAPKLEEQFRTRGARVKSYMIDSGHNLGDEDVRLVREWLQTASAK
ncbi:MAG TPA: alpha/beta hydrolase [Rhizobiaceae bacterium]|nr:alpha/beta hydrolase [Rhizobiaceae bacterium]